MIRVVIADHHRLFRSGLRRLLNDTRTIDIVAEAGSGDALVDIARDLRPHVVLVEIAMPGIGGLEAARRVIRLGKDIRVVVVTGAYDEPYAAQALRVGVSGFVTKSSSSEDVVTAIKCAHAGQRFVSSDVAQRLAFRSFEEDVGSPFDQLSSREMQITLMVINCHRVQDISDNLHLSPKTVNSYRYRIFNKLSVSSDVELALLAVKHGMINPKFGSAGATRLGESWGERLLPTHNEGLPSRRTASLS